MEEKKLKLFAKDVKLFGDDIEVIEEKFNFDNGKKTTIIKKKQ